MKASLLFFDKDSRILDGIRRGDEGALVELFHGSERAVTSMVLRNSGTSDDARDVLQEAIVVLWERIRNGRYEQSAKLGTFVFATARNLWLQRLARRRREIPHSPDPPDVPDESGSPLDMLVESDEARLVAEALAGLGEPCRSLLLFWYWEELTLEEIAKRMGYANTDTVKSKKYQCKKGLEKLLRAAGAGND
jgi:RNA polymerase sigma factor (sigma-70 family)